MNPFPHKVDRAIILGAGFSKIAGLPDTKTMTKKLLSRRGANDNDKIMISIIKKFLVDVFQHTKGNAIPTLEDIFTMIDLSANSGHYLSENYPPRKLRALRRFLIHRLFTILNKSIDQDNQVIRDFLNAVLIDHNPTSHFIVLNWDIVLEHCLARLPWLEIDYCIEAEPILAMNATHQKPKVAVAKIHGSSNWVYCDNCRRLFYDLTSKLSLDQNVALRQDDLSLFIKSASWPNPTDPGVCRHCNARRGFHIATFSLRKSFRTQYFASSWLAAEQILREAKEWIFWGYSLQPADYEFKHLLKSAELAISVNAPAKKIWVINPTSDRQSEYKRFFGSSRVTCVNGSTEYVRRLQGPR